MRVCKNCGNLLSDNEIVCSNCHAINEIPNQNMVNNQQMNSNMYGNEQPVQQYQTNMQQVQANTQQPMVEQQAQVTAQQVKTKKSKMINKKTVFIGVLAILVVLSVFLVCDDVKLRKKVKTLSASQFNPSYHIDDTNKTDSDVTIKDENHNIDFEVPKGTYPKVSQNYVFFIKEDYVANVMDYGGGLSLLNLKTGGSAWIATTHATLESYRGEKEALKRTYESRGIKVLNMYDKIINEKDSLILELMQDNHPTILVITPATEKESFLLTITNSHIDDKFDYETVNDVIDTLKLSKKIK